MQTHIMYEKVSTPLAEDVLLLLTADSSRVRIIKQLTINQNSPDEGPNLEFDHLDIGTVIIGGTEESPTYEFTGWFDSQEDYDDRAFTWTPLGEGWIVPKGHTFFVSMSYKSELPETLPDIDMHVCYRVESGACGS